MTRSLPTLVHLSRFNFDLKLDHTGTDARRRSPCVCSWTADYFFFAAFFFVAFFAFFLAAIVLSPGKEGFIPADPPVDRWVMRRH